MLNLYLKFTIIVNKKVINISYTIQINTALKLRSRSCFHFASFVTIQINTALKQRCCCKSPNVGFVTIQINTALKPRRSFRNRAAHLSQTTDLNDF